MPLGRRASGFWSRFNSTSFGQTLTTIFVAGVVEGVAGVVEGVAGVVQCRAAVSVGVACVVVGMGISLRNEVRGVVEGIEVEGIEGSSQSCIV